MINQISPDEEIKEITKLFNEIDVDHNGVLTKDELIVAYTQLYGEEEGRRVVEETMYNVDCNNDGMIDYNEFLISAINKKNIVNEQGILKAFKALDLVDLFRITK